MSLCCAPGLPLLACHARPTDCAPSCCWWQRARALAAHPPVRNGTRPCPHPEGQLASSSHVDQPSPAPVLGAGNVQSIAMSTNHMCLALRNGSVACAGLNHAGQLGDAAFTAYNSEELRLVKSGSAATSGLAGARLVAVNEMSSFAALSDGGLVSWGATDFQGGFRRAFAREAGLQGVESLAAAGLHVCVALTNGTAWCKGVAGGLGEGGPHHQRSCPAQAGARTWGPLRAALHAQHHIQPAQMRCWHQQSRCWASPIQPAKPAAGQKRSRWPHGPAPWFMPADACVASSVLQTTRHQWKR